MLSPFNQKKKIFGTLSVTQKLSHAFFRASIMKIFTKKKKPPHEIHVDEKVCKNTYNIV